LITNNHKPFKYYSKFLSLMQGKLIDPVTLEIDLTNACNNNCEWCIDKSLFGSIPQTIKMNNLKEFLFSLKDTSIKSVVLKGGGEPLLYKQINKVLYILKKMNIKIGLITNGQRLHLHKKAIKDCCSWIRVSISANNAIKYGSLHKPTEENAFQNIKKILNLFQNI
jgi:cyclic pyranopterin phosphate synthase